MTYENAKKLFNHFKAKGMKKQMQNMIDNNKLKKVPYDFLTEEAAKPVEEEVKETKSKGKK